MNFTRPKTVTIQIAPDIYHAVCVGVWDLGLQASTGAYVANKPSYKVMIGWELQSGEFVNKEYTRQIDEWTDKATKTIKRTKLKEDLESWFSPHKITDPSAFDARKLLGQHCRLVIGQTSGGFPKVVSVSKPDQNAMNWEPHRQPVYFEVGDEIPAGTDNWVANRIAARLPEPEAGEEPQQSPAQQSQASGPGGSVPF